MSGPVDVLAVMDTSARAIALLSDEMYDQGKPRTAESWSTHLVAHDKARAAVAELIAANKNLIRIIESAGLINLSIGVQLGQVSWHSKASEAMEWNVDALARVGDAS